MQGIALQHYQELIPETRAVYISNAAKMDAYKKVYARVLQQLQEATAIHLQQQTAPTWITHTQTGVRLQALTTLNYSMLATQMRMNQEEAMKNSTPKTTGGQMIHMRVPIYPATAVQQKVVQRTPTLVRTESRPLATALEIMETERQKGIEDMQAEQANTPEPEIPKAPVSTPDTEEEKEEEKAKDKKEDQTQASTPNQETQGRNNGVEIVEHATPPPSTEQPERRITRSQSRKKQKTEETEFFHIL